MAEQDQVQEVPEEETVDPVDEAAFMAQYNARHGIEPEVIPEAAEEVKEPIQEEAPPESDAPKEEVKTLIAGMTEQQVKDLLAKAGEVDGLKAHVEKAYGKIGELNMKLQQSRGVKVTPEHLKRVAAEYPELAKSIAEDLNEVFQGESRPQEVPDVDSLVKQQVSAEIEKINQETAKRWLKLQHSDWQDISVSPDFQHWKASVLSSDQREKLDDTWDVDFIADKLTEFKAYREKTSQETKLAEQAKQEQDNKKQKRLEAAVAPTSGAAPVTPLPDDEEAFMAAYKKRRAALARH